MFRTTGTVVLLAFCAGAVFFAGARPAPAAESRRSSEIAMEKKSQEYTWLLRIPIKPGVVQVSLLLRDAAGKPVQGRKLTGDLWMPHMPMKGYPLELEFVEGRAGEYVALAQYGHGGYWQVRAVFEDERGNQQREVFDLQLSQ